MVSLLIYRETLGLYVLMAKSILQIYDPVVKMIFTFLCVAHIHTAKDVSSPSVMPFFPTAGRLPK